MCCLVLMPVDYNHVGRTSIEKLSDQVGLWHIFGGLFSLWIDSPHCGLHHASDRGFETIWRRRMIVETGIQPKRRHWVLFVLKFECAVVSSINCLLLWLPYCDKVDRSKFEGACLFNLKVPHDRNMMVGSAVLFYTWLLFCIFSWIFQLTIIFVKMICLKTQLLMLRRKISLHEEGIRAQHNIFRSVF